MDWFLIASLVVCRIIAATWANVLQKRSITGTAANPSRYSPLEWLVAIWGWMSVCLCPWWIPSLMEFWGDHRSLAIRFWFFMFLASALEVPGNYLLLRSLKRTDLSIFGPLSSYKPIVGMFLAWLVLSEVPTIPGFLGMVIVLMGSYLLADFDSKANKSQSVNFRSSLSMPSGVRDRLMGVALTAAGAVVMKLSMMATPAVTSLAVWSVSGWVIAIAVQHVGSVGQKFKHQTDDALRPVQRPSRSSLFDRESLLIAIVMIVMQGCTIVVLKSIPVGYSLALFQLGSLLSVYIGHRFFGEGQLVRRLIAATIMLAGATIIVLSQS